MQFFILRAALENLIAISLIVAGAREGPPSPNDLINRLLRIVKGKGSSPLFSHHIPDVFFF